MPGQRCENPMKWGWGWRRLFLACPLPTGMCRELLARRRLAAGVLGLLQSCWFTGANLRAMKLREGLLAHLPHRSLPPPSPPDGQSPILGCSCSPVPFHSTSASWEAAQLCWQIATFLSLCPAFLPPTQAQGAYLRRLVNNEPAGTAGCV